MAQYEAAILNFDDAILWGRRASGRYEAGEINLNKAIIVTPRRAEAFALRARALLALGRDGEAARDLEKVEQLAIAGDKLSPARTTLFQGIAYRRVDA